MRAKYFFIVAAIICAVSAIYVLARTPLQADKYNEIGRNINLQIENPEIDRNTQSHGTQIQVAVACDFRGVPLSLPTSLRKPKIQDELVDELLASGFAAPEKLVAKSAEGDPASSIALFKLLRNCFAGDYSVELNSTPTGIIRSKRPSCPSLPATLVAEPIKVLEKAAENGSAEAGMVFAKNAETFARIYKKENHNESPLQAQEILKKAERYGEQAARDGLADAYLFMSHAHETGIFGVRDLQLAYSYWLPIQHENKYDDRKEHMKNVVGTLTPKQVTAAKNLAFGCPLKAESDTLKSPFGNKQ